MANSVDPDEMLHSVAFHLGLHCLLRHVCPNLYGKLVMERLFLTEVVFQAKKIPSLIVLHFIGLP